MTAPAQVQRAQLQEISWDSQNVGEPVGEPFTVQFNPETLKVGFSAQDAGQDQSGGAARQYLRQGKTSLSLDLWFDVTTEEGGPDDVRQLTTKVIYFIAPQPDSEEAFRPPGIQFLWGSFLFRGIMDSANETLEFFSEEGKPLRASVSISLSELPVFYRPEGAGRGGGDAGGTGQRPGGATGLPGAGPGAGGGSPSRGLSLPGSTNSSTLGRSLGAGGGAGGIGRLPARGPGALNSLRAAAARVQGAVRAVDEPFQQAAARLGVGDRWQELADLQGIEQPRFNPAGLLGGRD